MAVISAIFGRSDVKEAAKELRDAVERALWTHFAEVCACADRMNGVFV